MNEREIKELPRNMDMVKKEFQKVVNLFNIQHEKENESIEDKLYNKSLFFVLLNEFYKFLHKIEESTTVDMKSFMEECKTNTVYFGEYGKKVFWDNDACWFYIEDMTKSDYLEYDKIKNKKFLENR